MSKNETLYHGFLRFVEEKKLFSLDEKILLAVSGGMDSMVMVSLFKKGGFNFGISHCNFCLRGDESVGDEEAVRTISKEAMVPFYLQRFDTKNYADDNKLSIQQAARELRYKWFEKIIHENGYTKLATAHHLNDSIETFFINIMRGSGLAGMRGIPVTNNNIIRPLLFATREEISQYAKSNNIFYRTDSSNETDDYLRNRIRHHLSPVLYSMMPDFDFKMQKTFSHIDFMYRLATDKINEWKRKNIKETSPTEFQIPLAEIRLERDSVSFLSFLLYTIGITDIDASKVLQHGDSGAVFYSSEYELLRDRDFLILRKRITGDTKIHIINTLPAMIQTGKKEIRLGISNAYQANNSSLQQIDLDKASQTLTIRPWATGDYFYPLGMAGRKKISDYLIDQKINRFEKENTFLLLSGNDIVCILGHRIDERFKVTSQTEKILTIEFL